MYKHVFYLQLLQKLYLDSATVVWNGNAVKGLEEIIKFYDTIPTSEHNLDSLDCQPLTGLLWCIKWAALDIKLMQKIINTPVNLFRVEKIPTKSLLLFVNLSCHKNLTTQTKIHLYFSIWMFQKQQKSYSHKCRFLSYTAQIIWLHINGGKIIYFR